IRSAEQIQPYPMAASRGTRAEQAAASGHSRGQCRGLGPDGCGPLSGERHEVGTMRRFGYAWRALAAGALLVGLAALQPAGVLAATDTVTTCDDSSGAGTLRSVIANAAAGDTVRFSCSGTITLTSATGGPITLSTSVIIDGSGAPG